jgi:hypothetical protein
LHLHQLTDANFAKGEKRDDVIDFVAKRLLQHWNVAVIGLKTFVRARSAGPVLSNLMRRPELSLLKRILRDVRVRKRIPRDVD